MSVAASIQAICWTNVTFNNTEAPLMVPGPRKIPASIDAIVVALADGFTHG